MMEPAAVVEKIDYFKDLEYPYSKKTEFVGIAVDAPTTQHTAGWWLDGTYDMKISEKDKEPELHWSLTVHSPVDLE